MVGSVVLFPFYRRTGCDGAFQIQRNQLLVRNARPEPDKQNPVPVCSRAGPNSFRTAEAVMQDTLLQVLALR